MRLPQATLASVCFLLETPSELIQAMGEQCSRKEAREIQRLFSLGLPPITSRESLSVMLGYNPGFIWSLLNRTHKYYRKFEIPKGSRTREIYAPKIALKAIQKWLGHHFERAWQPSEHIFGFVPGRSHIQAAAKHLSARWVYSIDLENYFPSVSERRVQEALRSLGYSSPESLSIISTLCCLKGSLVQGSPASPVLSNMVLQKLDRRLTKLAERSNCVFTRYADDIVFSSSSVDPGNLPRLVNSQVVKDGWAISERKVSLSILPERLKVHGLLVHGDRLRLTKGYRNRVRAFHHLLNQGKIKGDDLNMVNGHLNYASQIANYGSGN